MTNFDPKFTPREGQVSFLRARFEEADKQQKVTKQPIQSKNGVSTQPPSSTSTSKSKDSGKIVETGHGDEILRPREEASTSVKDRVSLFETKSPSDDSTKEAKHAEIGNRATVAAHSTGIVTTQFKPQRTTPKVAEKYLSSIRMKSIQEQSLPVASRLGRLKSELEKGTLNEESIKKYSDELADLALQAPDDPKIQSQIKELQNEIKLTKEVTAILIESHKEDIKTSFQETLKSVCQKHGLSEDDIRKEANLIGRNEKTAMMKMIKRLDTYRKGGQDTSEQTPSLAKRMERTGYDLSVVKGVEHAFKKTVRSEQKTSYTQLTDKFAVIVSGRDLFLEEKTAGTGSYKVATFTSNFYALKKPEDKMEYVTLKPKKKEPETLRTQQDKTKERTTHEKSTNDKIASKSSEMTPEIEESNDQLTKEKYHTREHEKDGTTVSEDSTFQTNLEEDGTFQTRGATPDEDSTFQTNLGKDGTFQTRGATPDEDSTVQTKQTREATVEGDSTDQTSTVKSGTIESGTIQSPKINKGKQKAVPEFLRQKKDPGDPQYLKDLPLSKWPTRALKRELKTIQKKTETGKGIEKLKKRQIEIDKLKKELSVRKTNSKNIIADEDQPTDEQAYLEEIELCMELQGPGVVEVHSVTNLANNNKIMIQKAAGYQIEVGPSETEKEKTLIIDLKAFGKMNRQNKLNEDQQKLLMSMLDDGFEGVERLHDKGYIHRDLKPENILATREGGGALTDFGSVCQADNDNKKSRYIGTPRFSAPELVAYSDSDRWSLIDKKSDVWSCGMILMDCCFPGITAGSHTAIYHLKRPEHFRDNLAELINDPDKRDEYQKFQEPTDKDSLEHLVWQATRLNPEDRPTMSEFREKFRKASGLDHT